MHYTLCDLFSDLTQNSIEAQATQITVELTEQAGRLSVRIADNGKGMTQEQLARATDPFWTDGIKHPGRKVGLGIPFLIQTAETSAGSWNIRSSTGTDGTPKGTVVQADFDLNNIDTPPVGDVAGYFRQILTFDRSYELVIVRTKDSMSWSVSRSELCEALGVNDPGDLCEAGTLALVAQYLEANETA